ncbi:hypothetical protein M1E17_13820 [Arthrobacter sp. D1-29]
MELNEILNHTADRVVAEGTYAAARTLEAMASAAGTLSPGAAAALVDWAGPEVARLRAFGLVHGLLLRELPAPAQAQLAAQLVAPSALVLAA